MKTLHCLGDSHAGVFNDLKMTDVELRTMIVEGATATGLRNPNPVTDARKIFASYLAAESGDVLFCLGEVDCGFVMWYRAEKYGTSLEEQLAGGVNSYLDFVREHTMGFDRVILLSPPLPTILDGQDWGHVANLRREVKATLKERTELTLEFGRRVSSRWPEYIDVHKELLDPLTGVVREEFRSSDRLDHHLNGRTFGRLLQAKLLEKGYK